MSVVIAGRTLKPNAHANIGLTAIYGIGRTRAKAICDALGIAYVTPISELSAEMLDRIRVYIGEHYTVEGDLVREKMTAIESLKRIGCHRGRRHRYGLPVRGQRTKTNSRTVRRMNKGRRSR